MKTRSQELKEASAHSDAKNKRRGPGRPRLDRNKDKNPKKDEKSNLSIAETRPRRTSGRHNNDSANEKQNISEPLDIQSTFDFKFPPDLPINEGSSEDKIALKSKSGKTLGKFQSKIHKMIQNNYFDGKSFVLFDESNWIKFTVICSFLESLKQKVQDLPPNLIITSSAVQSRWLESLQDWSNSLKVYVFKPEKKNSSEMNHAYPLSNPVQFDVMIITREQFIKDGELLPKIAWNSIIVDDLSDIRAPIASVILQFKRITFQQSIVITIDFDSLNITDLASLHQIIKLPEIPPETTLTISYFKELIQPSILHITIDDAADNFCFYGQLLLCPMTQHQQKLYLQVFNECMVDMKLDDLIDISIELRNAATHPFLQEMNKEQSNDNTTSGKIILLDKLLNHLKSENRRIVIVCANSKTVSLVHSSLLDHEINHLKFDNNSRNKNLNKTVQQFNSSIGFSVIIIPAETMENILPVIEADTIICFDIEWTPFDDPGEFINWCGRTETPSPKLFQLLSKNTHEQLLFEYLWRNRSISIEQLEGDLEEEEESSLEEDSENKKEVQQKLTPSNHPDILFKLIKNSAKIAFEKYQSVRGVSWTSVALKDANTINFEDEDLFPDNLEDISDEAWKKLLPKEKQSVETNTNEKINKTDKRQMRNDKKKEKTKIPAKKAEKSPKKIEKNTKSEKKEKKVKPKQPEIKQEQRPKSHTTRPLPASQFWTVEKLVEVASILDSFGLYNWDLFSKFQRNTTEIIRVVYQLLKHILNEGDIKRKSKYETVQKFIKESSSNPPIGIPALQEIMSRLNPPLLLQDIELIEKLKQIVPADCTPQKINSINLEGKTSPPLAPDWTDKQDRELLFNARKFGLMHIPETFYPDYKDHFVDRVRQILTEIIQYDKEMASQPTIISLRKPKIFSLSEHSKIIQALMAYGFPSIDEFAASIDLPRASSDSINRYVNNILRFCAASLEDRRSILPLLAEKIPKYTASKIPQRVTLFHQIRESVHMYHDFPAEDIEFLSAIAFHGFRNYSVSPILNVACAGNCSEIKLYTKIKAIFAEKHRSHFTQRMPADLKEKLPLKINDMMVLTNIGEITGYHTEEFIYPVNYQCAVVAYSPIHPEVQIWINCTILEKDDKPWFVVEPREGNDFKFESSSPDLVFQEYRKKMSRNSKFIPPFDGHEMFGLKCALIHRIFIDTPGIEKCDKYERRFFKAGFSLSSTWPIIGQFEKEQDRSQSPQPLQMSKFKYKRKLFGDILQPLVLDFSPLFTHEKSGFIIDLKIQGVNCADMVENYSQWLDENKK